MSYHGQKVQVLLEIESQSLVSSGSLLIKVASGLDLEHQDTKLGKFLPLYELFDLPESLLQLNSVDSSQLKEPTPLVCSSQVHVECPGLVKALVLHVPQNVATIGEEHPPLLGFPVDLISHSKGLYFARVGEALLNLESEFADLIVAATLNLSPIQRDEIANFLQVSLLVKSVQQVLCLILLPNPPSITILNLI